MTDQEIRDALAKAEALLAEYISIAEPVAEELALRHSEAVGRKYDGNLGCWEQGIDCICLHLADGEKHPSLDDHLTYDHRRALDEQFFAGLTLISLRGYF